MPNNPLRVAQVIGMAVNGGTESLWMNYYRHIDRSKVQFDFLVESTSEIINKEEIESLGGHVVIIPSYKNPIKYVKALTKIFKEQNYDIVHSNMNAISVFTLKAAKKAGVKVRIAHNHATTSKKEFVRNIAKQILKKFSKKYATDYFTISKKAGEWYFGKKCFASGKVKVVNAFDLKKYNFSNESRDEIRNSLNVKNNEVLLGNVGRMVQTKNQLFLLDVFHEYHKKNPNSKLLIVGDGPLKDELEDKTDKLCLNDNVIFYGVSSNIAKLYSAMDLFLFPSLYEGLGLTSMEAQASGLPSLVSTGVSDETKMLETNKFIDLSLGKEKWVQEIEESLSHKIDRSEESNKAQLSKFDIEKGSKDLVDLYYKLLNK